MILGNGYAELCHFLKCVEIGVPVLDFQETEEERLRKEEEREAREAKKGRREREKEKLLKKKNTRNALPVGISLQCSHGLLDDSLPLDCFVLGKFMITWKICDGYMEFCG